MGTDLLHLLKLLSDPTRLRLLALLDGQELAAGELARAIAMSPSRVSNHLKLLREGGLLEERREGAFTYARLALPDEGARELWQALRARIAELEEAADDRARLDAVLEERRRKSARFFDAMAVRWDAIGREFTRGTARLHALSALVPPGLVVADVGCGTGYQAEALARVAARVICVDHSTGMLARARANLASVAERIELRPGELHDLPLQDGEVDAVFAHMVLHHLVDPTAALAEMRRALKPGGRLAVVDLLPHKHERLVAQLGDVKLGLDRHELARRLQRAGFDDVETRELDDRYRVEAPEGPPAELELFLATARRPRG
jgi:ubiquinone/menaquinone biosynthesis C-methylase UbiE/DNA-binding transcriptional ArsR family regulator